MYVSFDHQEKYHSSHEPIVKMGTVSHFVFCFPMDSLGSVSEFTEHLLCARHYSKHFTYIILTVFWNGYPHLQIREMMHREGK